MTNAYDGELGEVRAEVVIQHPLAKVWFTNLQAEKAAIESELGEPLVWHNPNNARMCRLYVRRDADIENRGEWEQHQGWLKERLEAMHRVFAPRARSLPSTSDVTVRA